MEPLRHRQTKGAATDMFYLTPPRHISTLQTRRFGDVRVTSAFPLIADLRQRGRQVRKVPQNQKWPASLVHLVGALLHSGRIRIHNRSNAALLRRINDQSALRLDELLPWNCQWFRRKLPSHRGY